MFRNFRGLGLTHDPSDLAETSYFVVHVARYRDCHNERDHDGRVAKGKEQPARGRELSQINQTTGRIINCTRDDLVWLASTEGLPTLCGPHPALHFPSVQYDFKDNGWVLNYAHHAEVLSSAIGTIWTSERPII